VVCSFTKYLIVVPLRNKTALVVAKALVDHVYLIYGPMELCVHDGGKEFCNDLQVQLSKLMGTQVSTITAYRPSSNGAIERTHSTINAIFAKTVKANQKDWCQRAAFVAYAYNTAYHRSTTYSPFFLMFGRHPTTSLHWSCTLPRPENIGNIDEYVLEIANKMRAAYDIVREQLKTNFDRAKTRYDHRIKEVQFAEGEFVWFSTPRRKPGIGKKWQLTTTGPYKIIQKLSQVNFIIQKTPTSAKQIVHLDRLTHYVGSLPLSWTEKDRERSRRQPENNRESSRQIGELRAN
jgi:hypothetical protein